jgi:hypothetical protein
MDVLALLGEDVGFQAMQYKAICVLNLPSLPGYCCRHKSELGVIVGDNRVGNPNAEDNVLHKAHCLLGVGFSQGPSLNPLRKFVDHDQQVG